MARKTRVIDVVLSAQYVPLPSDMKDARRAGLLLLWQLIKANIAKEVADGNETVWVVGDGVDDRADGSIPTLLSVEDDIERT